MSFPLHLLCRRASFRHPIPLSLPPIAGSEVPSRPPATGFGRGIAHPTAGLAHSNAFTSEQDKWPNATSAPHTTGEPCSPALTMGIHWTWPDQCLARSVHVHYVQALSGRHWRLSCDRSTQLRLQTSVVMLSISHSTVDCNGSCT